MKVMEFVSNPALLSNDMDYAFDRRVGALLLASDGTKIDYVCRRARELAAEGKKVIIWSSFVQNVELIASEIGTLLDKDKPQGSRKRSGLLITHLGYILNFVSADKAHVLIDGVISCSGNPTEILEDIRKNGFNGCVECAQCL